MLACPQTPMCTVTNAGLRKQADEGMAVMNMSTQDEALPEEGAQAIRLLPDDAVTHAIPGQYDAVGEAPGDLAGLPLHADTVHVPAEWWQRMFQAFLSLERDTKKNWGVPSKSQWECFVSLTNRCAQHPGVAPGKLRTFGDEVLPRTTFTKWKKNYRIDEDGQVRDQEGKLWVHEEQVRAELLTCYDEGARTKQVLWTRIKARVCNITEEMVNAFLCPIVLHYQLRGQDPGARMPAFWDRPALESMTEFNFSQADLNTSMARKLAKALVANESKLPNLANLSLAENKICFNGQAAVFDKFVSTKQTSFLFNVSGNEGDLAEHIGRVVIQAKLQNPGLKFIHGKGSEDGKFAESAEGWVQVARESQGSENGVPVLIQGRSLLFKCTVDRKDVSPVRRQPVEPEGMTAGSPAAAGSSPTESERPHKKLKVETDTEPWRRDSEASTSTVLLSCDFRRGTDGVLRLFVRDETIGDLTVDNARRMVERKLQEHKTSGERVTVKLADNASLIDVEIHEERESRDADENTSEVRSVSLEMRMQKEAAREDDQAMTSLPETPPTAKVSS